MHKRFYRLADEGRAAEAAADQHFESGFARLVLVESEANIVHLDRRAIVIGSGNRKFELARQERELRMQRGVLPQQLDQILGSSTSPGATPAHWSEVTLRVL